MMRGYLRRVLDDTGSLCVATQVPHSHVAVTVSGDGDHSSIHMSDRHVPNPVAVSHSSAQRFVRTEISNLHGTPAVFVITTTGEDDWPAINLSNHHCPDPIGETCRYRYTDELVGG